MTTPIKDFKDLDVWRVAREFPTSFAATNTSSNAKAGLHCGTESGTSYEVVGRRVSSFDFRVSNFGLHQ
jgi:hypothetical protein